jgi:hypothetical protein
MAYGDSPFDGSMTAAISANVSFPQNDQYGSQFKKLLQSILQASPGNRPTLKDIEINLVKLAGSTDFNEV